MSAIPKLTATQEKRIDQLSDLAFWLIATILARGVTYPEGKALLQTVVELMDQIDTTPGASDLAFADFAKATLIQKLSEVKP